MTFSAIMHCARLLGKVPVQIILMVSLIGNYSIEHRIAEVP